MKKLLMGALASSLLAVGGVVTQYENLVLKDDVFQVFEKGKTILEVGFGTEESFWKADSIVNYESLLTITRGAKLHGETCLLVEGGAPRTKTDTAWAFRSKSVPYTGQAGRVSVQVRCCTDMYLQKISGNNHDSYIVWTNAEGKWLGKTPIQLGGCVGNFSECQAVGEIPEGTKAFFVLMGFDAPNVTPGKFCAFSKLTITALKSVPEYVDNAYFWTAPVKLDRKTISWKCNTPAGTGISVQVSQADDVDGCPGEWSDFAGPHGKATSWFTSPFAVSKPWIKLRVQMRSNGQAKPELEEMTIGNSTEKYWKTSALLQETVVENLTESPTKNRRVPVSIRLTCANSPVKWNTFKAELDGKDVTTRFVRNGEIMTLAADHDYADGRHELKVQIENINGIKTESSKLFVIGEGPKVDQITLRDDGMTLINGKPFFPIGAYAVSAREFNGKNLDKAFKDLSEAGFNFAHTYGAYTREFLDTAQKYGMRVWARAYRFEELDNLKFNHPSVLAWYIGDDTSIFTTPSRLQDLGDAIKAVDGKRVITQADGTGFTKHVAGPMDFICTYQRFVRATDNFLPEIYPVREDNQEDRENCVPCVIRDTKACLDSINSVKTGMPKSVWSIIQYFDGWGNWKRFPTEDELRAMSYATIVYGATGITWYTYGGWGENHGMTSTPERWAAMTRLTRQLNELTPVLVERKPADQPEVTVLSGKTTDAMGFPSVACLMKRHNGETYIIAVNSSLDTVKASFRMANVKGGTVMFEGRNVALQNGQLTDVFAPYAVHIYRLK